jgi:Ca2+/Na+ antiporter
MPFLLNETSAIEFAAWVIGIPLMGLYIGLLTIIVLVRKSRGKRMAAFILSVLLALLGIRALLEAGDKTAHMLGILLLIPFVTSVFTLYFVPVKIPKK